MKLWEKPHIIKVYEALGIQADKRLKLHGNTAEVISSNGNRTYNVIYDPEKNTIVANDLGSFWQRYLSYPEIAFLLASGKIKYDAKLAEQLKGIKWKNLNDQYKHDYNKVLELVNQSLKSPKAVREQCERILTQAVSLKLKQPENLLRPPK